MSKRVVWQQGLLIRPQHLQQQDRAYQHLLAENLLQPRVINWGVTEIEWDESALRGGTLRLTRCAGFFANGANFSAPSTDQLPLPLTPETSARNLDVYLITPVVQPGQLRVAPRTAGQTNFEQPDQLQAEEVHDDSTPPKPMPASVNTCNRNLMLLVAASPPSGMHVIRLARIASISPSGSIVLDTTCWPVAMVVRASPTLTEILEQLAYRLYQKSADSAGGAAQQTAGAVQEMLVLSVVNRAAPIMRQIARTPEIHPYDLHLLLIGLASELQTFQARWAKAKDYAFWYDHVDQYQSFLEPLATINEALERQRPRRAFCIPFTAASGGYWKATFPDVKLVRPGTSLFVSFASSSPQPEEAARKFLQNSKTHGADQLRALVDSMINGLKMVPHRHAPPEVQNPKATSFWLEVAVPLNEWPALVNGLGVHIAVPLPDVQLELWVVVREPGV